MKLKEEFLDLLLMWRSPKAKPIIVSFNSEGICSKVIVFGCLRKERGIGVVMYNKKPYIPAKTGNDNNNKTAVITTAHPNKVIFALQKISIC